jgi:hypothetical protein
MTPQECELFRMLTKQFHRLPPQKCGLGMRAVVIAPYYSSRIRRTLVGHHRVVPRRQARRER